MSMRMLLHRSTHMSTDSSVHMSTHRPEKHRIMDDDVHEVVTHHADAEPMCDDGVTSALDPKLSPEIVTEYDRRASSSTTTCVATGAVRRRRGGCVRTCV